MAQGRAWRGEGAEATFRALREYCALDTRGVVEILV
jgi:hypothetical protein